MQPTTPIKVAGAVNFKCKKLSIIKGAKRQSAQAEKLRDVKHRGRGLPLKKNNAANGLINYQNKFCTKIYKQPAGKCTSWLLSFASTKKS
jgi:hypothetical protein